VTASTVVASAMAAELAAEAHLPRWRRQSLNEARRADPKSLAVAPAMTFHGEAATETERALVRYDLVRMTDVPDEITGAVVAELQSGDEIEIVERRGVWLFVRTPFGAEGWIHRTTIGRTTLAGSAGAPAGPADGATSAADTTSSTRSGSGTDPAATQDTPMLESLLAGIVAKRKAQAPAADVTPEASTATETPTDPGADRPTAPVADGQPTDRTRSTRPRTRRQSSPQTTI
jgi:hypothetical protein